MSVLMVSNACSDSAIVLLLTVYPTYETELADEVCEGEGYSGHGFAVSPMETVGVGEQCEIDIIYGQGISKEGEILDRAVELGIIKKSASWFEYNGNKIAQGRDAAKAYIKENEDVAAELLEKIKNGVVAE